MTEEENKRSYINWNESNRETILVKQLITRGVYTKLVPGTQEVKRSQVAQDLNNLEIFKGYTLDQKNLDKKYKEIAKKIRAAHNYSDDYYFVLNYEQGDVVESELDKLVLDLEHSIAKEKTDAKEGAKKKQMKQSSLNEKAQIILNNSGRKDIKKVFTVKQQESSSSKEPSASSSSKTPPPSASLSATKQQHQVDLTSQLFDDDDEDKATLSIIQSCKETMKMDQQERLHSLKIQEIEQERMLLLEKENCKLRNDLEKMKNKHKTMKRKYSKLERQSKATHIDSSYSSDSDVVGSSD